MTEQSDRLLPSDECSELPSGHLFERFRHWPIKDRWRCVPLRVRDAALRLARRADDPPDPQPHERCDEGREHRMSALIFMDTETTGLSLDDDIWEFAAVRRDEDGTETVLRLFLSHDERKCRALPESFRTDHDARFPRDGSDLDPEDAIERIGAFFRASDDGFKPHVIGAVPNFDTERLGILFRRYGYREPWHYHLIDIENLAVGYLAGLRAAGGGENGYAADLPSLPWNSDDLSRACGVEPPTTERHTAMGDVRWAMALYDAITGRRRYEQ